MTKTTKIFYTKTDEAPALATASFLPIVKAITSKAGIEIEVKDISLASRILAAFPDKLTDEQKQNDALAELGELVKQPDANIVKLPNISASVPQLEGAISELQSHGYDIPTYPIEAKNDAEKAIKDRYSAILGSAVNPVIREGNSSRRVATPVKNYAKKNPHSMGEWSKDSKTHVSYMANGDFFSTEKSVIIDKACSVKIILNDKNGKQTVLKDKLDLKDGEIIDASVMSKKALRKFIAEQIKDAKEKGVLFSAHLKATMMKVSDPIMFGHIVSVFFKDVYEKYADLFKSLEIHPNNGLGELYHKIQTLPEEKQNEIKADIQKVYETHPQLAMVDSEKGITNLHVPSDVIIDASMPAAIRASGKMWGPDGKLHDIKAIIPDKSYARIYEETINFCKENGAFDVTTMGTVQNIGLMAQKAEEYGSHDKTFEIPYDGTVRVIDNNGKTLIEHEVEQGDIWRMCQAKDIPIKNWVELAVRRARATKMPAYFWLEEERGHDRNVIKKVKKYLKELDTDGLDIQIMSPRIAIKATLERVKAGKDTISVTGNVMRDFLTDLFPILELGTSSKVLSIVPLLNGGGLYETGAGGCAPKHIKQFIKEGHLRWDSLGEFLALAVSLEEMGKKNDNKRTTILSKTLITAIEKFLDLKKSPTRNVNGLDNRGSHFYLTMYWVEALAKQDDDTKLKTFFEKISKELEENETTIMSEINATQGKEMDLGGYYNQNEEKTAHAMRPSKTFNKIIEKISMK